MDAKLSARLEALRKTVQKVLGGRLEGKNIPDQTTATYFASIREYLQNMRDELARFQALVKGERKPTVGVFGCPSRGKSSLLNVLLGVDVLPMKGKPGTTVFGTELKYANSPYFTVTVAYNNKRFDQRKCHNEQEVKDYLKYLSDDTNIDVQKPDVDKIEIEGPFKSFVGTDIVFVDTPGVELGAASGELKDIDALGNPDGTEHDFEADKERALKILSTVDVVIFCMILKYKERKDAEFYNREIIFRNPINVVNAGDARDEGQSNAEIIGNLIKDYKSMIRHDTLIVSAKEALEIIRDKAATGDSESLDSAFMGQENLDDFLKLRDMLRERTENSAANNERRVNEFEASYARHKEDALEHHIHLPELPRIFDKNDKNLSSPIEAALLNGELTQQKIEEIRKIAKEMGYDPDEVENYVNERWAEQYDTDTIFAKMPTNLKSVIKVHLTAGELSAGARSHIKKTAEAARYQTPAKALEIAEKLLARLTKEKEDGAKPRSLWWYFTGAFKKYAVFKGRARRKEFWGFCLFDNIFSIIIIIVLGSLLGITIDTIATLVTLVTFLPSWSLTVRRCHDINRSAWWLLVPIYGWFYLGCYALLFKAGTPGPNRFGPDPKQAN